VCAWAWQVSIRPCLPPVPWIDGRPDHYRSKPSLAAPSAKRIKEIAGPACVTEGYRRVHCASDSVKDGLVTDLQLRVCLWGREQDNRHTVSSEVKRK